MTTRDQQIAAAVIEAAAKAAFDMPLQEKPWGMPYQDDKCKAMALDTSSAIRALDRDAILASVPKQEDKEMRNE